MTLEYYPGSDAPAHATALVDGRRLELDCRALTGDVVVPKLQEIFTPAKSSRREFDLKEAARWGHHGSLGDWHRVLPDFLRRGNTTSPRINGVARLNASLLDPHPPQSRIARSVKDRDHDDAFGSRNKKHAEREASHQRTP